MVAAPLAFRAFERRPVPDRDHRVLEERPPAVVRVDVSCDDGLYADRLRELPQPSRSAARHRARTDAGARRRTGLGRRPTRARPLRSRCGPRARRARSRTGRRALRCTSRTGAGRGSAERVLSVSGEYPACAAVSSRQRFAYPRGDSTSSVTCEPSERDTSAPVIGRTPNAFAACANSSDPYTPS